MERKGWSNACEGAGIGKPKKTERERDGERDFEKPQRSKENTIVPERHRKCFKARQALPNL